MMTFTSVHAVDVNEIIQGYIDNTGGIQAWNDVKGIKMSGEFNQQGMVFPFEVVNLKDGRQYMNFSFQGKEIKQGVFDGESMWNTNFMTMKAERSDAESTENQKLESNDFPFPFIGWKEKGYAVELLGTETKDGSDTYKVKLVKEPITIDGQKIEDVSYYYFDTEAFVPVLIETQIQQGPMKGKINESKLSDYQEVDGLFFPFSLTQGIKDGPETTMVLKTVELNPTVSESDFAMPLETPVTEEAEKTASKTPEND